MPGYFLDTGVLVGLTFLQDVWHDEAERLFATDNTLYTSEAVLYEYCNRTKETSFETADVDWTTDEGLFGEKRSNLRADQLNLNLKLDAYDDGDLDLETLVDLFLTETKIEENVYPRRLVDERIRPRIRSYFEREIGEADITARAAREAMDGLIDTILEQSERARERIRARTKLGPQREDDWSDTKERLRFVDGYIDTELLCDAAHLEERNRLERVVSTDKSDIYSNRDRIHAILGIRIVYIKDEFAEPTLPRES